MEEKTICSVCGAKLTDETAIEFDGKVFCDECLRRKTITCDCCGKLIYRDEIHNDDAHYEDDSDYPYCAECFMKMQRVILCQISVCCMNM